MSFHILSLRLLLQRSEHTARDEAAAAAAATAEGRDSGSGSGQGSRGHIPLQACHARGTCDRMCYHLQGFRRGRTRALRGAPQASAAGPAGRALGSGAENHPGNHKRVSMQAEKHARKQDDFFCAYHGAISHKVRDKGARETSKGELMKRCPTPSDSSAPGKSGGLESLQTGLDLEI